MSWVGAITNAGESLLAQYRTSGTTLYFTKVETGTVVSPHTLPVNLKTQTALVDPVDEGNIASMIPKDNFTMFKLAVGPASASYTMYQVGLFAKLGASGTETLLALFQNSTGAEIPTSESFPDFAYRLSAPLAIGDASNIEISIEGSPVYITEGEFNELIQDVWKIVYPVGSIYMSANSVSPATLFGGTWVQLKDRFLLGAGDNYTAGDTGGAAQHSYTPSGTIGGHALTVNEMPVHGHTFTGEAVNTTSAGGSHSHTISNHQHGCSQTAGFFTCMKLTGSSDWAVLALGSGANHGNFATSVNGGGSTGSANINHTHSVTAKGTVGNSGGGQEHSHTFNGTAANVDTMPPYLVVYMWKRQA